MVVFNDSLSLYHAEQNMLLSMKPHERFRDVRNTSVCDGRNFPRITKLFKRLDETLVIYSCYCAMSFDLSNNPIVFNNRTG